MQSAKLIINELKPRTALLYKRQMHRPAINSTILRYPHKTSTLRSNRNISALKDGTLKSAEIVSFRQSQSIDNQCLFFCQNVTSFTGKEKDSETGFYYFGARYYDPSLSGLFISVDPMSDKYPSISPYAYCAWNPVKVIDPNGEDTIVSVNINDGKTSYWYDNQSFNGTAIEIVSDNNTVERYKCSGVVSMQSDLAATRTTLSFADEKDARNVFEFLNGSKNPYYESKVEWDYYNLNNGGGDLVTSHSIDENNKTGLSDIYNKVSVKSYHHFHPKSNGSAYWTPSIQDQYYAMSLNVPCYLHFTGQSYRFDDIVNKYGVMSFYNFQRHIPLTIFK